MPEGISELDRCIFTSRLNRYRLVARIAQSNIERQVYAVSRIFMMDPMRAGRLQNNPVLLG
jgi:hypothetical protein